MLSYILKYTSKIWHLLGLVVAIFLCPSYITANESVVDYTIQYKTNKNDDYGAIAIINKDSIEIRYMGNQYEGNIKKLGYYKGKITDKEYTNIINLANDNTFLNAKSDKDIAPGDPYTLITLMQGEKAISSKAYRGGAYDEPSQILYMYLYNTIMNYMSTLEPEIGLSLTYENMYTKDSMYVLLDFTLRNEGKKNQYFDEWYSLYYWLPYDFRRRTKIGNSKIFHSG